MGSDLTIPERISGRFTHEDSPRTQALREGTEAEDVDQPGLASQSNPTVRNRFLGKRRLRQDRDSEKALPTVDARTVAHDPNVETSGKSRPSVVIIRNTNVYMPNLIINVYNQVGRGELYIVAVCGLVLQLSILIYFGIAATYLNHVLLKDGGPVAGYAFPCTAVGLLLLVARILLCAHVIDSSTSEKRYRPAGSIVARVVWLQRSGTVNDQAFESFAVFPDNPQPLVTTSQRAPRQKLKDLWLIQKLRQLIPQFEQAKDPKQGQTIVTGQPKKKALERLFEIEAEEVIAVTSTMLGICGFVAQFIGLRGMH